MSRFFREAAGGERLAQGAQMTIVDEQHVIADEHFTVDGHAGARIEEPIWETLHMKASRIHPVKLLITHNLDHSN
jgi:hypothetical protein